MFKSLVKIRTAESPAWAKGNFFLSFSVFKKVGPSESSDATFLILGIAALTAARIVLLLSTMY